MKDFATLEQFIQERMSRTKLAGLSLALIKGDEIIYQRGFGLRSLEQGLPATPETLYGVGSITKTFTSMAILQLQERGLLSVEDPVERYLPLQVKPFGETIRIKHLMSHTSGIPSLGYGEAVIQYKLGALDHYLPMGGTADMLAFMNGAQDWVQARPGERYFYLNEGYVLLGAIIEQLSGQPYTEYVTEQILRPLGMNRSFFRREQVLADRDAAVPYLLNKEGRHEPREYPYGQVTADGGLISSITDMARYVSMLLRGGGEVLSGGSLAAMMTPQVRTLPEDPVTGKPVSHYGFGLSMSDLIGRRLVGHGGSVLVATAQMQFLPDEGIGAIVLANGSGYPMGNITAFALAQQLGENPWEIPALRTEKVLSDLTGFYEGYRGNYSVTVRRQGDFLMAVYKNKYGEQTVPLFPMDLSRPEAPVFATLAGGSRMRVEFFRREGRTEMLYERNNFRRTGAAQ